jgi:hypothetical protein
VKRKSSRPPGSGTTTPTIDRSLLTSNHPVNTRQFQFPTAPLIRAVDTMSDVISAGGPGCSFEACSRTGKSWAAKYAINRLPDIFPDIPFISYHAHSGVTAHPGPFYADIYKKSGYALTSAKIPWNIRDLLAHAWFVEAASRRSSTIVFIGDEMQNWYAKQLTFFVDLSNDLEEMGVRLISIFFGQTQLSHIRATLRSVGRGDILGRFMTQYYVFEGIASARELQEVFACYDDVDHGEFPVGSGICYTQFFLPEAYRHGWRLASCAGLVWQLFSAHVHPHLGPAHAQTFSIGMQWIAQSVRYMFMHFADDDRAGFSVAKDQWNEAIVASGFLKSLGLTYLVKKEGK